MCGILRASAALTMAAVDGPRYLRSTLRRSVLIAEQQFAAGVERQAGAFAVEVADHQLVDAARGRFAGASEAVGQAGQAHQFERDVLEDVAGPGAFLQAAQEAAALVVVAAVLDQPGQPGGEPFVEAGNLVRRQVFEFADVDPGFQAGRIGPDAGAAQGEALPEDDVLFLHVVGCCRLGRMR